jgi:4-hydroxy-tetrahydrodipicolinate synthase
MNLIGSTVALVTPFNADGSVDYGCLRALIDWHIAEGTHVIGVVGTTGESPTVTHAEQLEIIRVAVEQAKGRVTVMAGAGSNSTTEAIAAQKYSKQAGADCTLQVVPYYNRPTQAGMLAHFRAVADACDIPTVLYNVPGRTVADMAIDTVLSLAEHPNIVGIKEASGNLDRAAWLIKRAPKGFAVLSGDDPTATSLMLMGGQGNVSVTANVAPRLMSELCTAAIAGDAKRAAALHLKALALHRELFVEPNPVPVKWALSRMGKCGPGLRLPLVPLSVDYHARVESALAEADCL